MDDCPVGAHRLEVIDSGSGQRLYTAMRDQAERGREFQRRVRWLWLRRELNVAPVRGSVIDLRDVLPTSLASVPLNSVPLNSGASSSALPSSALPNSVSVPLNSVPLNSVPLNSVPPSSIPLSSTVVPLEQRQEDSA
jgi:hypothetical protein